MDHRILFLGPVGAGKTTAIRSISDVDVVDTEVRASDESRLLKPTTTVAMDMGIMQLGDDRVVLYGAPGQDRFDFMWDILLQQSSAVMLVLDHCAADPVADLARYHAALSRRRTQQLPLLIGVTHVDLDPDRPLAIYEQHLGPLRSRCGCMFCAPPVQPMDARRRSDVRALLAALAALLDVAQRLPSKPCLA